MGYLIKSEVLDALKDDMGGTKACYEKKEEKAIVDMCYLSLCPVRRFWPRICPGNHPDDRIPLQMVLSDPRNLPL